MMYIVGLSQYLRLIKLRFVEEEGGEVVGSICYIFSFAHQDQY